MGFIFGVFGCESESGSKKFTIQAIAGANGSISPSGDVKVDKGESQKFTITPDAEYAVADVLVDDVTDVTVSH